MDCVGMLRPGKAIATRFAGVVFRSRLEANAALLLTSIGIRWQYERTSFLLNTGDHFAPDFQGEQLGLWFETRGYLDPAGDRQIRGFASMIHEGRLGSDDFLVVGPGEARFFESHDRGFSADSPAMLARCLECGGHYFMGESGDYTCRGCGTGGGDGHVRDSRWLLGIVRGVITIDGLPTPKWIQIRRELELLPPSSTGDSMKLGF